METISVILIIIMSVGAIQGLTFGTILFRNSGAYSLSNRILAVLLYLLSYRLLVQILRLFGLGYYDSWYYFMLDLSWVHGALFYFYVLALVDPKFTINKNYFWHFLPLVLQMSFSAFVRIQNVYWDGTRESLSWLGYWGYWLWMNQPTIHIVACALIIFYAIKAERVLMLHVKSKKIDVKNFQWLKNIVIVFKYYFTIIMIIIIGDMVFIKTTTNDYYFYFTRFYYYPFFIGISLLTYWVGIEGFNRRKINLTIQPKNKVRLSHENKSKLEQMAKDLDQLMKQNKPYLDSDLNLSKLAQLLGVKPYLLTQCLNLLMKVKFNDYINGFRVDEVKRLIKKPENSKKNLLTIALDAGFNSKSSFNRSVKNLLGIHPKDLR